MSAFGWITTGHRLLVASFLRRRAPRKSRAQFAPPGLESLEKIELMSRGLTAAVAPPAHVMPLTSTSVVKPLVTSQTTSLQTVTVPNTLTNFSQAFAPPVNLFNPALGTLVAVDVTGVATLTSDIVSQNTSTTSEAAITGFVNGNFAITGLSQTISGPLNKNTETVTVPASTGEPPFTGPTTVTFPPLVVSSPLQVPPLHLTTPAELAFYTARPGHTTISPVLTANAQAGANAPNGNLQTMVETSGSGVVTVSYEYIPASPPVIKLVRFGIHQQPTMLQLTFAGPLDPAVASNPANYFVIAPNAHGSFTGKGTKIIPIVSAIYNPAANTVTLTTAQRLNFHKLFQLVVNFPGTTPQVIEFGGINSLGGFTNPRTGQFVPVFNGVAFYPSGPGPLPR